MIWRFRLADQAANAGFHSALDDVSLDPDLLASDCLLELKRPEEALERVARSLQKWPGTLDGLARIVAASVKFPHLTRNQRTEWEAQLFRLHDPASARFALAGTRRRWGDPARAVLDASWIAERLPEAAPLAEFERALSYLELARPNDAIKAYGRSLTVKYYLHGTHRFDDLVRRVSADSPDNPSLNVIALSHWMRRGNHVEVRALLARNPGLGK